MACGHRIDTGSSSTAQQIQAVPDERAARPVTAMMPGQPHLGAPLALGSLKTVHWRGVSAASSSSHKRRPPNGRRAAFFSRDSIALGMLSKSLQNMGFGGPRSTLGSVENPAIPQLLPNCHRRHPFSQDEFKPAGF